MYRKSNIAILGQRMLHLALLLFLSSCLSGCYIFNFFKSDSEDDASDTAAVFSGTVAGQSLGSKAGDADAQALADVYAVTSSHAPAAIRPDPDLYVRRMLRQYRDEGQTIARQIGGIEPFRLLLGGASEDFSKTPQETYDATSLLAVFKVAEEVCRGMVAPNAWEHEGWSTILPYDATQEQANILWLAQRFIGKPSSDIEDSVIQELVAIMDAEEQYVAEQWGDDPYAKYIPVCATLALDAEALYL